MEATSRWKREPHPQNSLEQLLRKDLVIGHYDVFSKEYDSLSITHRWYSPEILFGLVFGNVKPGEKLLDVGIGTGLSSIPFYRVGLEIYGIDGSKEMLKKCRGKRIAKQLKLFNLRNNNLPYKDREFDHVISNGVFYFFENLEPFFKEAYRVLNRGGTFSFTVENLRSEDPKKYINKDNDLICKGIADKNGVTLFRHSQEYINHLINRYKFGLLKSVEYFAYNSPVEHRDVYFVAYVLRK
jgi:ubiquinone/menaquinone biosynthesis C-methylase UbiE